jgi:hypothetical protein
MSAMVPENAIWTVRAYGEKVGDYQLVSSWIEARGLGRLQENFLPPTGIIVEMNNKPVAASWLYLCYGIGVAFWEGLYTCPGLSLSTARAACLHCLGALKAIAKTNDVGVIKAYTKRALAAQAKKHGFHTMDEGFTSILTTT